MPSTPTIFWPMSTTSTFPFCRPTPHWPNHFDAIYGIEHAGFRPKPERRAFETVFALDALDPAKAAMFEDDARNLAAPHAMGMRTVHIAPQAEPAPHIHHQHADLSEFLGQLTGA